MSAVPLRWRLADEPAADVPGQGSLFSSDDLMTVERGTGRLSGMEFLHVHARRIINEVPAASRMPFRFTINAYRGCSHACTYCFARPTHDYLGLNIGEDFERRIVVKVNAVERLKGELRSPKWTGDSIAMGTNTDPYQRCEGKYRLTRGIVEVLSEARNPFSVLTKSALVLRDLDVLAEAARRTDGVGVAVDRHAGRGGVAGDRAGRAAPAAAGGRGAAARPRPGSAPACWSRRCCPGSPTRRAAGGGGDRLRRGRREVGHGDRAAPAAGRAGALPGLAAAARPRPGRRLRAPLPAGPTCRTRSRRRSSARVRAIAERAGARYATPAEARVPSGEAVAP